MGRYTIIENWNLWLKCFLIVCSIILLSPLVTANLSPDIKHGYFQITGTGTQNITGVGFEPDIIKFEITSTNENFDTQTQYPGEEWGWGHGFANINNGSIDEIALTVGSGSASTNGMAAASTNTSSISQVITPNDGDGIDGWVNASVTGTHSDGFSLNVDVADKNQYVTYTAYQFEDTAEIDIGYFNTSTSTGLNSIDIGFQPSFLHTVLQPHRSITNPQTTVQDSQGDNGWGFGFATQRDGIIEQLSMAVSMHSENIDYHSWGSSNNHTLYGLEMKPKDETITGRIKASLESFDNNGFTLNYDEVAGGQIALYMAVKTDFEADIGSFQTPTSTGSQTISTDIQLDSISMIGSNTINSLNSENVVNREHHGWMFGGGIPSNQHSMGFSSNSDSVNEHSSSSSNSEIFNLLYTDQDGNVLGRDIASLTTINQDSFELDWTSITTTATSGVNYDSVLGAYHGFSSIKNTPPKNEKINYTDSTIFTGENTTINATITDVNGNSTVDSVISTILGPNSTSYNISLNPEIVNDNLTTGNLESTEQNYTAINNGATIGEAGTIELYNRTSKIINLTNEYSKEPVIIAIPGTQNNDDSAYVPIINSINTTNVNISLCRDDGATTCDTNYNPETLHYMIFDVEKANNFSWLEVGKINVTTDGAANSFSFGKTFSNSPVLFGLPQTYNIDSVVSNGIGAMAWFPSSTTTGADIVGCDHPGTGNDCAGTATEEFGYVAIDTTNENFSKFDSGSESIGNSDWTSVSYDENYDNPILTVMVNSETGPEDPKYPWARNIGSAGAEIRYCESEGANSCDSHNGEDTQWMIFEEGLMQIGNGGKDIEEDELIKTYNNVFLEDTFNITNISINLTVSGYDNSGSNERGNNDSDLQIEVNTDTGWKSLGSLNISGVGTYSTTIENTSILNEWNTIINRDIRIRVIDFDYFDSTKIDNTFYDYLNVDVSYEEFTSKWNATFTNTSVCGQYNLTSVASTDKTNETNITTYSNKNLLVPCSPIVNLISPINGTKLITEDKVNFTWNVQSSDPNITCDFYLNGVFNQSNNCTANQNNSLLIGLNRGQFNWTVNATNSNNASEKPPVENFLNILDIHSSINKSITSLSSQNMYLINIFTQNLINGTRSQKVIDFVDEKNSAGSFNPSFNKSFSITGNLIGEGYLWNYSAINSSKTINYSISDTGDDYFIGKNFIIGLE